MSAFFDDGLESSLISGNLPLLRADCDHVGTTQAFGREQQAIEARIGRKQAGGYRSRVRIYSRIRLVSEFKEPIRTQAKANLLLKTAR